MVIMKRNSGILCHQKHLCTNKCKSPDFKLKTLLGIIDILNYELAN